MRGLPLRFGVALGAIACVAALSVGLLAASGLRERETELLAASLEERARLVASLLEPAFTAGDASLMPRVLAAARAGGMQVAAFSRAGERIAAASRDAFEVPVPPEVQTAIGGHSGRAERQDLLLGRAHLWVAVPAHGFVVQVGADLTPMEESVARLWRRVLMAGALASAAAFALGLVLGRHALRVLAALRHAAGAISRGDVDARLHWQRPDEIGELARAIDAVGETLRVRLRAARDEEERLRAVLNGMVEGVLVLDRSGHVILANRPFREFFDVWGDLQGRTALSLLRRTDVDEALAEATATREPVVREITHAGDERTLEMHAVRFPATGEQLGAVAVFHEVTELRRLEHMRSEFVANVSHELKTPLTSIRGFTEVLQQNSLSREQREQYLAIVARNAERLDALIEDLLELSRIEGRSEPVAREPIDVVAVARILLRDLKPRLDAKRIEAALDAPSARPALCDRRALERVLLNLLDNAVKYTDDGGQIRVHVVGDASRVVLEVSDDGIGIPAADLGRVFERFYRVDKARARDLGGTGLGLSIVKHLVQAMGGEIFVESREGEGTCFRISLPASG